MSHFRIRGAAGSLRSRVRADVTFAHRWTDGGVAVEAGFTGAHLLHLAVGGCVLNDVYREADRLGIVVHGVVVSVDGDFDRSSWASTGITYSVEIDSPSPPVDVQQLLHVVEDVAEIPRALQAGARVERRASRSVTNPP